MRKIRSALISLSDKSNLKPLLRELSRNNIMILFLLNSRNRGLRLDLSDNDIKADLIFLIISF